MPPVISVLHATRGRVELPQKAYHYWMSRARNPQDIEWLFGVDADDSVGNDTVDRIVANDGFHVARKIVNTGPFNNVGANNAAFAQAKGALLVQGSDDFRCPDGWDIIIRERTIHEANRRGIADAAAFGFDGVLGVGDPHFSGPYSGDGLLACIIGTKHYFDRIGGYFLYPEFDGVFADTEFTQKAAMDDVLFDAYDIHFYHDWHGAPNDPLRDDTYRRHLTTEANHQGGHVFNERTMACFPDNANALSGEAGVVADLREDRLGPPFMAAVCTEVAVKRIARGYEHIANKAFAPGSARRLFLDGHYAEAREAIQPQIKKYHKNICGGRFRFHGGVWLWDICCRALGDRPEIGIDEPLPF